MFKCQQCSFISLQLFARLFKSAETKLLSVLVMENFNSLAKILLLKGGEERWSQENARSGTCDWCKLHSGGFTYRGACGMHMYGSQRLTSEIFIGWYLLRVQSLTEPGVHWSRQPGWQVVLGSLLALPSWRWGSKQVLLHQVFRVGSGRLTSGPRSGLNGEHFNN